MRNFSIDSEWVVFFTDLGKLSSGECTTELICVFLGGTKVVLQNCILATSNVTIVVNIFNVKSLLNCFHARCSVSHGSNDWEHWGVGSRGNGTFLEVASEIIFECSIGQKESKSVSAKSNDTELEMTVESGKEVLPSQSRLSCTITSVGTSSLIMGLIMIMIPN